MSKEKTIQAISGWPMLAVNLGGLLVAALLVVNGLMSFPINNDHHARTNARDRSQVDSSASAGDITTGVVSIVAAVLVALVSFTSLGGHFTLQPNEGKVLILFGSYKGTVRESGFHWTNPFNTKQSISLRSRNLEGTKLKVNDKQGNPIEIAVVVVWHVEDTAQASFDVENYEEFVRVQSESGVRHLASCYAYDHGEPNEVTLRSGVEEVSAMLVKELQERLAKAGVHIEEARLTHLAYAPEIAGVMLRRQQAEAIIAARQKIVHGAVSMVQMALEELSQKEIVHLTEDRKAAMVGNLLVVLCGESEAQPVVNTGSS